MQNKRLIFLWMFLGLFALTGCSESDDSSGNNDPLVEDPDPAPFPSVGVPDQNSLSISLSELNTRGFNFDGTEVTVTARLADQLNNNSTIPDGTEVFFATEGGAIEPMCVTVGGACSVTWTSQNPRPNPGLAILDPLGSGEMIQEYSAGRATLLVWTLGTESFIDNNSNGLFDDGDTQINDIGEPFLDKNENGTREIDEEFVNFPIPQLGFSGTYDPADGLYSGVNCSHSTLCDADQSLFIFETFELIMSTDGAFATRVQPTTDYWEPIPGATSETLNASTTTTFYFIIMDGNGNPPIIGTTITATTNVGELVGNLGDTIGNSTAAIGNSTAAMGLTASGGLRSRYPLGSEIFEITVKPAPDNENPEDGTLVITVTTPPGVITQTLIDLTDPMN